MKNSLKLEAIRLRQLGLSYNEILKLVDVTKSTLSLWLRNVEITEDQKSHLANKQIASRILGGKARHRQRLESTENIIAQASQEVGCMSKRELWLVGLALYWAEGSKARAARTSHGVTFINTDGEMVKLFLRWLKDICNVKEEEISYDIYLHDTRRDILDRVISYWAGTINRPVEELTHIYYKRTPVKTNRKNIGDTYHGIIRVKVKKSTNLNRKILGWIIGMQHQDWGDQ